MNKNNSEDVADPGMSIGQEEESEVIGNPTPLRPSDLDCYPLLCTNQP